MPDLARELRLRAGPVPASVPGALVTRADYHASRDRFVLNVTPALRFHYRRGEGVRYRAGKGIDRAAVASFHGGSVHGAAAWMNGFLPLHASAVAWRGGVHAFAGVSGEGKSTLVAALARRGFDLFADDVLTLRVSDVALALPGHKPLRLWADALALTGHTGVERVWPGVDKFFVAGTRASASPLPLRSFTLLDTGDAIAIGPVAGAERLIALRDHCYRPEYRLPDRSASAFAELARVAREVPVFRFVRPRDLARFDDGVARVGTHIERLAA